MAHVFYDTSAVMTKHNKALVAAFLEGKSLDLIAKTEKMSRSHTYNIVKGICTQTLASVGKPWQKPRVTVEGLLEHKDLILGALSSSITHIAPQTSDISIWTETNIKYAIEVLEGNILTEVADKYRLDKTKFYNLILSMCHELGTSKGVIITNIQDMRIHVKGLLPELYAKLQFFEQTEPDLEEAYTDKNIQSIAISMDEECVDILRLIRGKKYDEFLVTPNKLRLELHKLRLVDVRPVMRYLSLMDHHKFCVASDKGYYFVDGILTPNNLILDQIETMAAEIQVMEEARIQATSTKTLAIQPIITIQPVTSPKTEEQPMQNLKVVSSDADSSLQAFTLKQIETLQYLSDKNPRILPFLKALSTRFGEKTEIYIDAIVGAARLAQVNIEKYEVLEFFASIQTIGEERAGDEKLGTLLGETIEAKASFCWAKKNGYNTPYNVNTVIKILSQ